MERKKILKYSLSLGFFAYAFCQFTNAEAEGGVYYYQNTKRYNPQNVYPQPDYGNNSAYQYHNTNYQQPQNPYMYGGGGYQNQIPQQPMPMAVPQQQGYQYPQNNMNMGASQGESDGKGLDIGGSYNFRQADFYFLTSSESLLHWDNMQISEWTIQGSRDLNFKGITDMGFTKPFVFGEYRSGTVSDGRSTDDDLKNDLYDISVGDVQGNTQTIKLGAGFTASLPGILPEGYTLKPVIGYAMHTQDLQMIDHQWPDPEEIIPWGGEDVYDGDNNSVEDGYPDGTQYNYATNQINDGNGDGIDDNIEVDGNYYYHYDPDTGDYLGYVYWDPANNYYDSDLCEYDNVSGKCLVTNGTEYQPYDGVTQAYKVEWKGFYAGATLERKISDKESFSVYGELAYLTYTGTGNWPHRQIFEHPKSFVEVGTGLGWTVQVNYNYLVKPNLLAFLQIDAEYFSIDDATTTEYLSGLTEGGYYKSEPYTETIENGLKEARWKTISFKLGGKYKF